MTEESSRQSIWFRHLPPWVIVVVPILAVVTALFLMPFYHNCCSTELAKRVICKTRLKGLGIAVVIYREDYDGLYPVGWGELLDSDYFKPKMLLCPASGTEAAEDTTPADLEGHVDYVLISGMEKDAPDNLVQAFELPRNHRQSIANTVYADTRVSHTDDFSEFMRQLQQVNDHLAELRRERRREEE